MTFRLEPEKVEQAQNVLGCKTRTDAIDLALDIVIGNSVISKGHDAIFGKFIDWQSE